MLNSECVRAKSLQSCLTLCDPVDSSPLASSVHEMSQARILEWIAMHFNSDSLVFHIQGNQSESLLNLGISTESANRFSLICYPM